jgi:carbamoyltransferase
LPAGIVNRCYLGPAYPSLGLPPAPRLGLTARRQSDPARFLAGRLADGLTVGLFHGRLEAGPRALGNRSILASPLRPDVVERLNATVKYREPFRPFAPVALADKAADYFTLPQPAPYMSIASGVTDLTRAQLPAIVHVNGTARVQTVERAQNPFLADVLTAFADLTGMPVLINTSLNVKGRPICGTPDMALDCLTASGLDALMIEGWWVSKA